MVLKQRYQKCGPNIISKNQLLVYCGSFLKKIKLKRFGTPAIKHMKFAPNGVKMAIVSKNLQKLPSGWGFAHRPPCLLRLRVPPQDSLVCNTRSSCTCFLSTVLVFETFFKQNYLTFGLKPLPPSSKKF